MSEVTQYGALRGLYMTACWICILLAVFLSIKEMQRPTSSTQPAAATPATYRSVLCDDETLHDFRTSNPDVITIKLGDGCFHDRVKMPVTWTNYYIHRSEQNGDWASVWCLGHPNPGEVRPYYEDMGNTFNNCREPQEQSDDFRLEGKGTITFRPLATAPQRQIPIEKEDPPAAAKLTPTDPEQGQPENYTVTIQQCYRSGEEIHCWGLATNLTDAPVVLTLHGATLVDDEGNSVSGTCFFPAAGDGYFTGASLSLIPGTPTRLLMAFKDAHARVAKVSLSLPIGWQEYRLTDYSDLIFKDIPLQ